MLLGNVGGNPEVRATPNGGYVTRFSLATNESWKDRQSGLLQERTEWHRIVVFNRLAEVAAQYLRSGSKIFLEGSLRTQKWEDKNGVGRSTTEIVAQAFHMLDSAPHSGPQTRGTNPEVPVIVKPEDLSVDDWLDDYEKVPF